jgi:hypothetical protein
MMAPENMPDRRNSANSPLAACSFAVPSVDTAEDKNRYLTSNKGQETRNSNLVWMKDQGARPPFSRSKTLVALPRRGDLDVCRHPNVIRRGVDVDQGTCRTCH